MYKTTSILYRCFALVFVCVFILKMSAAQNSIQRSSNHTQRAEMSVRALTEQEAHAWIQEQWTGDNRPYAQVRASLNKVYESKQDLRPLLQKYKQMAQQDPDNPLAQFRWGYTAWIMLFSAKDSATLYHNFYGVREGLARAKSPRTYDYARLRFLIEGHNRHVTGLAEIGERLASKDTEDYNVIFYLVTALDVLPDADSKRKALDYLKILFRLRPTSPDPYFVQGSIYHRKWATSHGKEEADKAIASFQKYLELAPKNDTSRSLAEQLIKIIQTEGAKYQALSKQ